MRKLLLCPVIIVLLGACQATEGRLDAARRTPARYRCALQAPLAGPLDTALPPFGQVDHVRVCPGENGQVGLVWERRTQLQSLYWDEEREGWHVAGTDLVLPPDRSRPWPPFLRGDRPPLPAQWEVLKSEERLGMAVLKGGKVLACRLNPDFKPVTWGLSWNSRLAYAGGQWFYGPVDEGLPRASNGAYQQVLLVFDGSGWRTPQRVDAPYRGGVSGIYPAGIFPAGQGLDVFWEVNYWPPFSLPDSGAERKRLCYTHVGGGSSEPRTVLELPKWLWGEGRDPQVVRVGGRYDVLYSFGGSFSWERELRHVRDVLHNPLGMARVCGGVPLSYSRFGGLLARAPAGDRVQMVWLEQPLLRERWRYDCDQPRRYQLREAFIDEQVCAVPRVIAEGESWGGESLAAAVIAMDGQERLLVIWRGEKGTLMYTVGSGWDGWSEPTATDIAVGARNWLVGDGSEIMLLTQVKRNLYWASLRIEPL